MASSPENFEDIPSANSCWPGKEKLLFTTSDSWWQNATIAGGPSRHVIMESGFKKAGDILVHKATENTAIIDFVVFPILYNYRHYLELAMKYVISNYGRGANVNPDTSTHNLEKLWSKCRKIVEHYIPDDEEEDETLDAVEELIRQFSAVDPNSVNFRYATDKNGQEIPLPIKKINLLELERRMDEIEVFFYGVDGYIDHLISAVDY